MNINKALAIVNDVEYKPNFDVVVYFRASIDREDSNLYFKIRHTRIDTFTGDVSLGEGPERIIGNFWTKDELVRAIFREILAIEEHEVREIFKYKNKPIFGPHIEVDKLVEIL